MEVAFTVGTAAAGFATTAIPTACSRWVVSGGHRMTALGLRGGRPGPLSGIWAGPGARTPFRRCTGSVLRRDFELILLVRAVDNIGLRRVIFDQLWSMPGVLDTQTFLVFKDLVVT
jgi:hypothetical protein